MLRGNVEARELAGDGVYRFVKRPPGQHRFDAQERLSQLSGRRCPGG